MIKQQFFLNSFEVLRLYHDGFDDYPKERQLYECADIKEGIIEFRESWIVNLEDETIPYDNIANGFLPSDHAKNPYGTLCCEYQEFLIYQKEIIKDGQIVQPAQFREVCEFVSKWCGYDLKKSPYSINNILIFTPTDVLLEKTLDRKNDRMLNVSILQNGYGELTCISKFKQNQAVVDTRVIIIDKPTASIESRKDWSSVDIEFFSKERLVYANYDLSFIKSINIDMGITTKQVKMDLQKANKTITLQHVVSQPIKVGESSISNALDSYHYQEELLKRQINSEKRFEFLTKGHYERGIDIFADIANSRGYKEMWIFDPYFITFGTAGGKARLNDIIKVLGSNLGLQKKIIFEAKQEDCQEQFTEFKEAIQGTVNNLKKRDIRLNFSFFGTSQHFHDRFIFLKNDYRIKSFLLGTSFNSFGDNYSTIMEIEPLDGRMVFETLVREIMDKSHMLLTEDLT
ncbi:hypothetical protein AWH48_08475 [Domibacillus aminovorans]|uniref:Uncharacterized protein n=1 Tax=Domibacillus aminovorans TaxID=29332 RepID=A0A177KNQ4_9BACI|nr:VPA1262 family N-terminal domain-containing protein [Domibacillus aminovorans]OAH54616.1 hypothetical protein AWH48_08475 [Domibacillus aminovorans]